MEEGGSETNHSAFDFNKHIDSFFPLQKDREEDFRTTEANNSPG